MADLSLKAVLSAEAGSFMSTLNKAQSALDKIESGNMSGLGFGVLSGIGMKAMDAISSAVSTLKSHLDSAISRVDTMNNFPKLMEQIGFSSDDAADSVEKLTNGVEGLPTALDDLVSSTQSLSMLTGDLEMATDLSIALNDAFLASGSASADASRGLRQYSQMLSKGKVDAQSWYTLQETMGTALNQVAHEMIGTSASSMDLYDALQSGEITFDQFNSKLIEMDGRLEDGSAGVEGFAATALTASGGIKTSLTNIGTAITKGLANSIDKANDTLKLKGLPTIQKTLENIKKHINNAFNSLVNSKGFEKAVEKIGSKVEWLEDNVSKVIDRITPYWEALTEAAEEVGAAFSEAFSEIGKQFKEINGQRSALNSFKKVLGAVKSTLETVAGAFKKLAPYIAKVLTQLPALATAFVALKVAAPVASSILKVGSAIGSAVKTVASGISKFRELSDTFSTMASSGSKFGKVMSGVMSGIGTGSLVTVCTAAALALQKIIWNASSAKKKLDEMSDSFNAIDDVSTSLDNMSSSMQDSYAEAEATSAVARDLASRLEELADKSNKTTAEQSEMKDIVSQLNSLYPDLGLEIDEVSGNLNRGNGYIEEYIDNMELLAKKAAVFDLYKESIEDSLKAEKAQSKIYADLADKGGAYAETLSGAANGNIFAGIEAVKYNKKIQESQTAINEASESQTYWNEMLKGLSEQCADSTAKLDAYGYSTTEAGVATTEAASDISTATDTMTTSWAECYENVSGSIDGMTSAFDELDDAFAELAEDPAKYWETLQSNLASQVEAYSNWNANVSRLMNDSLYSQDEDFRSMVNQIASAGIDMAPQLQSIVDHFDGSRESIDGVLTNWTTLEDAKNTMTTTLTDIEYSTQEGWTAIVEDYNQADRDLEAANGAINTTMTTGATNVQSALGQISSILPPWVTNVATAGTNAVNAASNTTTGMANAYAAGTATVQSAVNGLTSTVGSVASGISSESGAVQTAAAGLGTSAATGINETSGEVNTAVQDINTTMNTTAGEAKEAGTTLGNAFSQALKSSLTSVGSIATSASRSVSSGFRVGYGSAYSSGSYIGQGLVLGLRSQLSAVRAVAASLANTATSAIAKASKIGSPSKITAWQGKMIGQGLINGIEDKISAAQEAASRLFGTASIPASYELAGGYSYTPTMTVVNDAPILLDGKEVGRQTSPYVRNSINRLDMFDARKAGTR